MRVRRPTEVGTRPTAPTTEWTCYNGRTYGEMTLDETLPDMLADFGLSPTFLTARDIMTGEIQIFN
jgi:hypothetical protein